MRQREETILPRVGEVIERLGLQWEILRRELPVETGRAGALLRLQYPGGEIEYLVEVKARPTPRVADVFTRHAQQAAQQVVRITTALQHAHRPVQGTIRVGAADCLV